MVCPMCTSVDPQWLQGAGCPGTPGWWQRREAPGFKMSRWRLTGVTSSPGYPGQAPLPCAPRSCSPVCLPSWKASPDTRAQSQLCVCWTQPRGSPSSPAALPRLSAESSCSPPPGGRGSQWAQRGLCPDAPGLLSSCWVGVMPWPTWVGDGGPREGSWRLGAVPGAGFPPGS